MQSEADLKKLTVPQLKALCKEKRITGYSKLSKDALIQKLLGNAPPAPKAGTAQEPAPAPQLANNAATSSTVATLSSNTAPVPALPDVEPNLGVAKPRPKKRKKTPNAAQESAQVPSSSSSAAASGAAAASSANTASALLNVEPNPILKPRPQQKKTMNAPQELTQPSSLSPLETTQPATVGSTVVSKAPSTDLLALAPFSNAEVTPVESSKLRPKKQKESPLPPPESGKVPSLSNSLETMSQALESASNAFPPNLNAPPMSVAEPNSVASTATISSISKPPPGPKKRNNPSATPQESESESTPTTAAAASSSTSAAGAVFKVPAVPERVLQASSLTASSSTHTAAETKPKSKTKPKSSVTTKLASSTTISGSITAPATKKRKTVSTANDPSPGPSTTNAVTDTELSRTSSSASQTSPRVIVTPNTLKRPSSSSTDAPPPKRQKFVPPPPRATSTVLLPQAPAPIQPTVSVGTIPSRDIIKLPKAQPKRFVPLVVNAVKRAAPPQKSISLNPSPAARSNDYTTAPTPFFYLDFPPLLSPPSLSPTTLPPSISQRKRVPRLSFILSLLLDFVANYDLRNCILVSRMFRYAIYLSAYHRLSRRFAGQRLTKVLANYPEASRTTNMWPYLLHRMQEVSTRKDRYASSFLSRVFPASAISEHLWSSPDHERQIVVAIRFLLTRLFFQVSIGSGRAEKGWTKGTIVDVQQLVKDEVWTITIRHSAASAESFYVLEQTCEPLTATAAGFSATATGVPVRTDWSTYITTRAATASTAALAPLLSFLSWPNHEEYTHGISRLWLKRMEAEGELGAVKRRTAERYILACVVGNSLSGRWMSSTQMAQEQNGLAEVTVAPPRVAATKPKVNLFLPAHHHVESVHFTASGHTGMPLHDALAVVQTPGREYFILRDNGMQVGCEEEGMAEVWMKILSCENNGVALRV